MQMASQSRAAGPCKDDLRSQHERSDGLMCTTSIKPKTRNSHTPPRLAGTDVGAVAAPVLNHSVGDKTTQRVSVQSMHYGSNAFELFTRTAHNSLRPCRSQKTRPRLTRCPSPCELRAFRDYVLPREACEAGHRTSRSRNALRPHDMCRAVRVR